MYSVYILLSIIYMIGRKSWKRVKVVVCWIIFIICIFKWLTFPSRFIKVPVEENPISVGWLKTVRWTPRTLKVNIYDFLINPMDTCKVGDSNTTLLVLIKSAPSHRARRDVIRETYMSDIKKMNLSAKVLFVLGTTKVAQDQESIKDETGRYGDILQADFKDHYYNLTIKLVMGFKWVTNFCRNTEFMMSIDDDVMLDLVTLVQDLEGLPSRNRTNFCLGEPNVGKPIRNTSSKWYCPKAIYPEDTYPVSPYGAGYVLSQDAVQKLYNASKKLLPVVPFDDVYCGMLLHSQGISIVNRGKLFKELHPHTKPPDYLWSQLSVKQMKVHWHAWITSDGKGRKFHRRQRKPAPSNALVLILIFLSLFILIFICCCAHFLS